MLSNGVVLFDSLKDYPHMFFIVQKICIARIHKQRFEGMLSDVIGIGLLYVEKIIIGDVLLISPVPLSDVLLKPVYRRVQIYKQVRLDQLLMDDIKKPLV